MTFYQRYDFDGKVNENIKKDTLLYTFVASDHQIKVEVSLAVRIVKSVTYPP